MKKTAQQAVLELRATREGWYALEWRRGALYGYVKGDQYGSVMRKNKRKVVLKDVS